MYRNRTVDNGFIDNRVIQEVQRIVYEGGLPARIMFNDQNEARPPQPEDVKEISEIYIRDDGWSLGASYLYAQNVRKLWEDAWVVHLRKQTWGWQVNSLRPKEKYHD